MDETKKNETENSEMAPVKGRATAALVEIEAIQPIRVGETVYTPGQRVKVTSEVAKEFCDMAFEGVYSYGGYRADHDAARYKLIRAKRV